MKADLIALDLEMRACVRCAQVLQKHPVNPPRDASPVVPRPVFSPPMRAPLMLVGQAPGITEYGTGTPFSGQAGGGARALFVDCGLRESEFDRAVYQTSAAKCFPGRRLNAARWEDRPPCAAMLQNCGGFLRRQIEMVSPVVIVAMGGVAIKMMDSMRSLPSRSVMKAAGTAEKWDSKLLVHIAHTSGGNRFLNKPENKARQQRAKDIIREEIVRLRAENRL
ncbi:Uracil-DNA glycosylase superfamily [Methylobacterium sp. 4-46]|uniref:uracil-DNA glycosylase family protein n=1 Tax=unclassified Methylobacterium TaxID=2615210 RepID=UPI000165C8E7|nr:MULTISPECIES: uracil-DNA glycosylase family protein [Methylobacterium]ACA16000.1 Uracil-DNA glycosylase superfamily [Methylobacterium sp. 4-46]WFT81714.1 uracil-DNA glycosylase family protein [Methylobacterium nodulans]